MKNAFSVKGLNIVVTEETGESDRHQQRVCSERANVAILCKGIRSGDKVAEELSYRVIDINLNGIANMLYELVPHMIKAGKGGSIINISSIGGQSLGGARNHPMSPYHVSKAALDMFTKNMAIEFGDYDIRVNAVAPGPTHSDLDKDLPAEAFEKIEKTMPMHRFAEPIEIGALCVFLSSPAGCHITGTVIVHDGGMLLGG